MIVSYIYNDTEDMMVAKERSLTPVFRQLVSSGATINVYADGDVSYFKDSDIMWSERLPDGEEVQQAYQEGESIVIVTALATYRFAEQRYA